MTKNKDIFSALKEAVKTEKKDKLTVIRERIQNNFYNSEKVIEFTANAVMKDLKKKDF